MRLNTVAAFGIRNFTVINAKVHPNPLIPASVFWDFENCHLPRSFPISKFSPAIKGLLLKYGLYSEEIHAIGHLDHLHHSTLKGLTEIGVNMIDVSSKKPNAADMSILTAIARVMFSHKPPYGMVLISGDRDFTSIVNFMDRVGYTVILVNNIPDHHPQVVSDNPAHNEKWSALVKPQRAFQLKIPPDFRKLMPISEMRQRVNSLIGDSLSEKNLLETMPSGNLYGKQISKELACKDVKINDYMSKTEFKIQKLEAILPPLKEFIDKFGQNNGTIYEIKEDSVKSCGYTDQFHWALIAEYYDLIILDKATSKAKVSAEVFDWMQKYVVQDLELCRFLNNAIFLKEDNSEAKLIVGNISRPQIDALKMLCADFKERINDRAQYERAFAERRVVRVENSVALVLPWLYKGDPEDDRAIDQSNLLYDHPDFVPLIQYMQSRPSEIIDVGPFQIGNSHLIGKTGYKSWDHFYQYACKAIKGLKIFDETSNEITFISSAVKVGYGGQLKESGRTMSSSKNSKRFALAEPEDAKFLIEVDSNLMAPFKDVSQTFNSKCPTTYEEPEMKPADALITYNDNDTDNCNESVSKSFDGSKCTDNICSQAKYSIRKSKLTPHQSLSAPISIGQKINAYDPKLGTNDLDYNPDIFLALAIDFEINGSPATEETILLKHPNLYVNNGYSTWEEYVKTGEKLGIFQIHNTKTQPPRYMIPEQKRQEIIQNSSHYWIMTYFKIKNSHSVLEGELIRFFPKVFQAYGFSNWDSYKKYWEGQGVLSISKKKRVKDAHALEVIKQAELSSSLSTLDIEDLAFYCDLAFLSSEKRFSWISLDEMSKLLASNPRKYNLQPHFTAKDYKIVALSLGILESDLKNPSKFKMNPACAIHVRKSFINMRRSKKKNMDIETKLLFKTPSDSITSILENHNNKPIVYNSDNNVIILENDSNAESILKESDCEENQPLSKEVAENKVMINGQSGYDSRNEHSGWSIFNLFK